MSIYSELFSISNLNELRLNTPKIRLDAYSNTYYYMAPLLWNTTVTANIVNNFSLFSLNYFKKHLKIFLMSMQSQFDVNIWHDYNTQFTNFIIHRKTSIYLTCSVLYSYGRMIQTLNYIYGFSSF